jgi:hypothetical protein
MANVKELIDYLTKEGTKKLRPSGKSLTFVFSMTGALTAQDANGDQSLTYIGRIYAALAVDIRVAKLIVFGMYYIWLEST